MNKYHFSCILLICLWQSFTASAQSQFKTSSENNYAEALFYPLKVGSVEISMPEHAHEKKYHVCSVVINGERFDNVGIRTKGASSLDDVTNMKSDRYSFTLKLNKYRKGQKYHGMTKLLLNNNIWDATQMKDAIVYDMCRFIGLPASLTNYARITVNGKLHGCYLMVEAVDKHFCQRNYPGENTNIYKPYHNLAYRGEDLKQYHEISDFAKVRGDEASMQRVVTALKSVDEGKDIEKHVDIEAVMKYMALQTMAVNFDCMTGKNTQNYYLREAGGKISLIPWDYNLAWGGYPDDEGDFEGFDDFDPEKWKTWFDSLSQEQRDISHPADVRPLGFNIHKEHHGGVLLGLDDMRQVVLNAELPVLSQHKLRPVNRLLLVHLKEVEHLRLLPLLENDSEVAQREHDFLI